MVITATTELTASMSFIEIILARKLHYTRIIIRIKETPQKSFLSKED